VVSIIIPVLDDTEALRALLPEVLRFPGVEVVVVDGAGGVEAAVAPHPSLRVLHAPAGRAAQMNAGAAAAIGEWLLFLHADSRLPEGWLDAVRSTAAGGGWFAFALDDPAWQARVIEQMVAARVRILRLPYGDQGFFVRRELFRRLGGYADVPLMEDVDFIRRLSKAAPLQDVSLRLVTSARRWRRDGWWARSARNLILVTLFLAGVSPHRLARWYGGRRAHRE
jgi:rSAM/selenodomain-associated transferase 2